MDANPELPWSRVAAFVRQHTHDVRNHLNSLELEASLIADIVTDPEALESLSRIRTQIRTLAADLRALSGKFQDPKVSTAPIAASDLFEIWKEQWSGMEERPQMEWKSDLGDEMINVDASSVAAIFAELLRNAKAFGTGETLVASAKVDGSNVVFELHEPKRDAIDTETWGKSPLHSTRRHNFGLGLWEIDRAVQANGGRISRSFAPKNRSLVTSVAFPT